MDDHYIFLRYETLRNEYLIQTFNFMPELLDSYEKMAESPNFEKFQRQILENREYKLDGEISINIYSNTDFINN